jgi:PAS domain S-box-containing protein
MAVALAIRPLTIAGGQLLLVAILVTGWVGGGGPALVAWALAVLVFAYHFTPPFDSLTVPLAELPHVMIFTLIAGLMATVSAARRRAEDALTRARDSLEHAVQERTVALQQSNERLQGAVADAVAAQHRFSALVNSVEGIVWEADGETFVFSFVSEQAERILGYAAEQWLREPAFRMDHMHPADRDWTARVYQEATAQRKRHDLEYRMIAADGRVVWVRDLVTVVVESDRPVRLRGVMVDITARRRADEERQERRWIVENLDGVNRAIQGTNDLEQMMSDVLDATLSIFDCDRAWLMYPCDPEASVHEVKMQRTRPEFPSLLEVGDEVPIEPETAEMFRIVRASSGPVQFGPHATHPLSGELAQRRWVQSRIVMALYPKGSPPYIFGASQCSYAREWTAREEFLFQEIGGRLEDALTSLSIFHRLRESEKRYRHIFESSGVSILEEDYSGVKAAIDELRSRGIRDFRAHFAAHPEVVREVSAMVRLIDVNPASLKLFEAGSAEQLLASRDRFLVAESRAAFVEVLIAIAEGQAFFEAETALQSLSGKRLAVLFTITFPASSGVFDSVLVTLTDITERKRAEYLTGHVFDTSPDAMFIIGRDGRYQRVNPAFERRWRKPASRIVGMRVDELVGSQFFAQNVKPHLDRCFAGEEVSFLGWFGTTSGQEYLGVTYSPLRPHSKHVEAALGITRDFTEHARAAEALQKAQTELAHVTRITTLGELAASIAHEVNQPLGAIVADADASLNRLAAARPDLERVREALEAIVTGGHRAAEVIQRIRQLATKTGPQKTALDINSVIQDVAPLVRAELLKHDVSAQWQVLSQPALVLGDRVQLQQVLINLVINAIDAMAPVTNRRRELVVRAELHGVDRVSVAVQDNGIGIDSKSVDRVFDAFFTTKSSGMGMGLSISRSIVEAHRGRLWIDSNVDAGTTVQFSLPTTTTPGA